MEISKEEICVKIVDWMCNQPNITTYSNAVIISFGPNSDAGNEFSELINTYNYIKKHEEEKEQ